MKLVWQRSINLRGRPFHQPS